MPFAKLRSNINGLLGLGVDSQLRFSLEPSCTEGGFSEWRDAMKAVARLPGGVPTHFRKNLWSTLATQHIDSLGVDWDDICGSAFSEKMLPEDHLLTTQIIKDVHRTGCAGCDSEEDRVRLKRVLLGFARYNKEIGYCQGFNIIAALILQVVDQKTDVALKIMIFLVEQVLPRGYFDQSLRALSVDMAVLKELMTQRLPKTIAHLENLRANSGNEFEPGLTNVFSMHWFLTLYATCLPRSTVYRIWDAIVLEGSEVLLRTAVAIWAKIGKQVIKTNTADEFYTLMEGTCKQLSELVARDEDHLMTVIYTMSEFPYPGLAELREKYTWNIQPLSSTFKLFQKSVTQILHEDEKELEPPNTTENGASPSKTGSKAELAALQKQYQLLRQRQKQASLILRSAYRHGQTTLSNGKATAKSVLTSATGGSPFVEAAAATPVFNHLYVGETMMGAANGNNVEVPVSLSGGGAMALTPTIVQPIHYMTASVNASKKAVRPTNVLEGGDLVRKTDNESPRTPTKASPSSTSVDAVERSSICFRNSSRDMDDDAFSSSDSENETIRETSRPSSRRSDIPVSCHQQTIIIPSKESKEKRAMMRKSLAILDSFSASKPPPPPPNTFMRAPKFN